MGATQSNQRVLAASLLVLAAAVGWIVWKSELFRHPLATGIAVLPFENLSEQREDAAAFVDGVQDDILTKLARIADLKVISRSSVMEYRGKRNVRQIGNDLRVSHLLEGSVRRIGTRFHMNAQLIDTRTDTHVWVEQYDGDFNDLFAIQSEIAQKIAGQLHAKILPAEKLAIEHKPTGDLVAFELYSRAISLTPTFRSPGADSGREAIDLLNQAVARDPSFFDAYIELAGLMTSFTFLALTILLRAWRQQKQPFRKHSASVQMPAKHTWRERIIFIMDTSITRALWLNWKLLARRCPIIRGYFQ